MWWKYSNDFYRCFKITSLLWLRTTASVLTTGQSSVCKDCQQLRLRAERFHISERNFTWINIGIFFFYISFNFYLTTHSYIVFIKDLITDNDPKVVSIYQWTNSSVWIRTWTVLQCSLCLFQCFQHGLCQVFVFSNNCVTVPYVHHFLNHTHTHKQTEKKNTFNSYH